MAHYAILIYEDLAAYADPSPEDWQEMMRLHGRFAEQVVELGGQIVTGDALQPTAAATTIRGGVVTRGAFVDSKESLGGYYVIDAKDDAHAVEIAKLCPAPHGGVEVRPILPTSG
jgi:hypothetical protein